MPHDYTLTCSGTFVNLPKPLAHEIKVADIASALARLEMWNAICRRPYSYAEHALMVREVLERAHGVHNPDVLLCGLLTHASVAYLGPDPVRTNLPTARALEQISLMDHLYRHFDVLGAHDQHADLLARVQRSCATTVRQQLWPANVPAMQEDHMHPPIDWWKCAEMASFSATDWAQIWADNVEALLTLRDEMRGHTTHTTYKSH